MSDAPARGTTGALWATVLGSSVAMVDGSIVNVALPAMAKALDADAAGVQWIVNGYMLPLGALVLVGGALADSIGRKTVFLAGLVLFALASIGCMAAPTLGWLIAARVGQGVGAALLTPASLAILGADFDGEARAKAIGTWAAAGAIAAAIGPIIGGWLVDVVGWRWVFGLIIPLAAGAGVLAMLFVEHGRDPDAAKPDWIGGALATAGLGLLVWGLTIATSGASSGGQHAWPYTAGGVVASGAFLWWESRCGKHAMVPLGLFATRAFSAITVLTFLLYAALSGALLLLPYLLISTGWKATAAGAAVLPLPLIMGAGSRLSGLVAERIGARWMLAAGPMLVGIGFVLMRMIPGSDIAFVPHLLPAMLVIGLGMTIAVAPLTTTVMASVDRHHAGAASGVNNATARIGAMVAVALIGLVLTGGGRGVSIDAFHAAALIAGGVAVLAGVAGWFSLAGADPAKAA